LAQDGHPATRVHTIVRARFEKQPEGFAISRIDLETEGVVPGLDEAGFRPQAQMARQDCPVSRALAGVQIDLKARLVSK
jgi:osmotically inducible protein OsmC